MKKLFMLAGLLGILSLVVGCTDAKIAKFKAIIGSGGQITCYSGGKVIYEGTATGKIATEEGSDGWYFMDSSTNRLVRVSGDCVIRN